MFGFDDLVTEEYTKGLYEEHAFNQDTKDDITVNYDGNTKQTQMRVLDKSGYKKLWLDILEIALVQHPDFQRAVIDESQTPGIYDFSQLRLHRT